MLLDFRKTPPFFFLWWSPSHLMGQSFLYFGFLALSLNNLSTLAIVDVRFFTPRQCNSCVAHYCRPSRKSKSDSYFGILGNSSIKDEYSFTYSLNDHHGWVSEAFNKPQTPCPLGRNTSSSLSLKDSTSRYFLCHWQCPHSTSPPKYWCIEHLACHHKTLVLVHESFFFFVGASQSKSTKAFL